MALPGVPIDRYVSPVRCLDMFCHFFGGTVYVPPAHVFISTSGYPTYMLLRVFNGLTKKKAPFEAHIPLREAEWIAGQKVRHIRLNGLIE